MQHREFVFLDIETLGMGENAVITQIAAVYQNQHGEHKVFNQYIDWDQPTRVIDPSVVAWWMRQLVDNPALVGPAKLQGDAARGIPSSLPKLKDVLISFREWYPDGDIPVWSQGSSFDFPILSHAYRQELHVIPPWKFYHIRDARTMMAEFRLNGGSDIPREPDQFSHCALGDTLYGVARLNHIWSHARVS